MGNRVSDEDHKRYVRAALARSPLHRDPIDHYALDLQDERERNVELTKLANISKALKNCDRCGNDVAQYCVACMEKNNGK